MKTPEGLIRDILEYLNTDPDMQALTLETWHEYEKQGRSAEEFELWKAGLVRHFFNEVALTNDEVFDKLYEDVLREAGE